MDAEAAAIERTLPLRQEHDASTVIERRRDYVYRLALAIVSNPDTAQDVAQEVLLRISKNRNTLRDEQAEIAWARKICVRCAVDALKVRKYEDLSDVHEDTNNLERPIHVADVLRRLPEESQAILALAYFEQLSYREMAEALGVPEGTVASRLNTAKAQFKKLWEES
ncbi:MAG: RNA polymerase sigma factor [Fimbriimonadaceae bacterium]|nr:RNA polymerase sigma factor [Fimbriimonadaceae bacterium]